MEIRASAPAVRRRQKVTVPAPERSTATMHPAPEYATVAGLLELYRTHAVSPVEVVRDLFARIEKYESSLHCFVTPTREIALTRARAAEQQWMRGEAAALTGIPYGLKDVISTAGVLTTGQSKILEHNIPEHDAAVQTRMQVAGGVLMGKLTTY